MASTKPATTYKEQLCILSRRGISIEDEESCIEILENVNYYRLIAYFLPYKITDDTYQNGTSFMHIYRLYEFDRKLRQILFSALEEVEISLRSRFGYYHAHKYGPTGYLDPNNYNKQHDHIKFNKQIQREIKNHKNSLFVKHHLSKYNGVFPIWVMTELFTFGMLSYFYADLPTSDQKCLAKSQYHATPKEIKSWLRCCTDLRNICAHYGRLYYRIFAALPAGISGSPDQLRHLWGAINALRSLFINSEKWNNEVLSAISALFEEYSQDINLYHISFPTDWEDKLKK